MEPVKEEKFEPCDASGRPMFGLKALKKSPQEKTTFTATQVAKESSSSVQEFTHKATPMTEVEHLGKGTVQQTTSMMSKFS